MAKKSEERAQRERLREEFIARETQSLGVFGAILEAVGTRSKKTRTEEDEVETRARVSEVSHGVILAIGEVASELTLRRVTVCYEAHALAGGGSYVTSGFKEVANTLAVSSLWVPSEGGVHHYEEKFKRPVVRTANGLHGIKRHVPVPRGDQLVVALEIQGRYLDFLGELAASLEIQLPDSQQVDLPRPRLPGE